jgi:hypothetical protein
VWGFVAGFGTTFASAPDLIAMLKRRSSVGFNPRMASILAVFQVTWVYYGLLIGSRPVVAWNVRNCDQLDDRRGVCLFPPPRTLQNARLARVSPLAPFPEGSTTMNAEQRRLDEARAQTAPWRKWGPYLSERQWGTVREDYSKNGDAWNFFTHDQARSRAYRWGEDGLGGISDDQQRLCFALALWNGKDPILKERLFGLTNGEGNHGEDVKE